MLPELTNLPKLRSILSEHHFRPNKRLGQHFLVNHSILKRLLEALELDRSDILVEMGAGIGTITLELALKVRKVVAFELDPNLCLIFRNWIRKSHLERKISLMNADALSFNSEQLPLRRQYAHQMDYYSNNEPDRFDRKDQSNPLSSNNSGRVPLKFDAANPKATLPPTRTELLLRTYKVVGAIPYQISSPLIHHLLIQKHPPSLMVLILQKELADKIVAKPPKATYLSNFITLFGQVEILGKPIKPSTFWPPPKVHSVILKIRHSPQETLTHFEIREFSQFLHRGFSHPRKMLKKIFTEKTLKKADLNPTRRAQTLTLAEWVRLYPIADSTTTAPD